MAYYTVVRKLQIIETVIVKANSEYEAFMKAGEDVDCIITNENEGDYEPDYQSASRLAYVSAATKHQIG